MGVVEGSLPQVREAAEVEPPERVGRAYTSLGLVGLVGGGVTAAGALALCQAFGMWDLGAMGGVDVALAAAVGVALTMRRLITSRDHFHERMSGAAPVPEGAEMSDRSGDGMALARRVVPRTVKLTALVVGVVAVLHWIDPDVDRWPLIFAALVLGNAGAAYVRTRWVRRFEREHGVELFFDLDDDEDEDDLPAGDPGPMFRR